jgi:hypothetical protein
MSVSMLELHLLVYLFRGMHRTCALRETYSVLCKVYGGKTAPTNFFAPTKLSYDLVWLLLRRHLGPPRRGRRCPWCCHVGLSA